MTLFLSFFSNEILQFFPLCIFFFAIKVKRYVSAAAILQTCLAFILKLKLIVTTPPPPKVCSCRKWIEISHNNEILQAARKMFRPCKNLIPSLLTANVREIPKSILVNVSVFRNVPWRLLQNCTQFTPLIIEVLSIVNKFFQFQTLLLKLINGKLVSD